MTLNNSRIVAAGTRPAVDVDTLMVMDRAICELADRRYLALAAANQLHLLASLIAQAEIWIAEQVALTRQDGISWAEIARLLGTTAATARQRFTGAAQSGQTRSHARRDRP
jgi:hypothetical protein